jgi:hypothetical protein
VNNNKQKSEVFPKRKKVFLGYSNIAGNTTLLVRTLSELGYKPKYYYIYEQPFQYGDHGLGKKLFLTKSGKFNRILFALYAVYFILAHDIFIYSGQNTLLPSHIDLKIIKFFKKKIIFQFTGCDVRDYRWFMNSYDYKYNCCKMCTDEYKKFVNCKIELKINIVNLAEKYSDLILAHSHYQHLFTKKFEFFWVAIDTSIPQDYEPKYNLDPDVALKIIHAPSHIDIKGTKYVEEAVKKLICEGFNINYERIQNLPNNVVQDKIMSCDLVIDQLFASHGLLSVEAMKYSKPVICYMDEFVLKILPEAPPIIKADPETFYETLKRLVLDRNELKENGKKGRDYVLKYHNAEKLVKKWIEIVDV